MLCFGFSQSPATACSGAGGVRSIATARVGTLNNGHVRMKANWNERKTLYLLDYMLF
jgi:hypothetical protein